MTANPRDKLLSFVKEWGYATKQTIQSRRHYLFRHNLELLETLQSLVEEKVLGMKVVGRSPWYYYPDPEGANLAELEALERRYLFGSEEKPTPNEQLNKLLGGTTNVVPKKGTGESQETQAAPEGGQGGVPDRPDGSEGKGPTG